MTYKDARDALIGKLALNGWVINTLLKVPHATSPGKEVRLWFKAQSIYFAVKATPQYDTGGWNMGTAHSMHLPDLRTLSWDNFNRHLMHFTGYDVEGTQRQPNLF